MSEGKGLSTQFERTPLDEYVEMAVDPTLFSDRTGTRRLGVLLEPSLVSPLQLINVAAGTCHLVWIADRDVDGVDTALQLASRSGSVVDVTGLRPADAVAAVRAADISGLLAFADSQLPWISELAAAAGVPFHDAGTIEALSDKGRQRQAFADAGLPTPAVWVLPRSWDSSGVTAALEDIRFPVVVKPVYGAGSRDIVRLESRAQLAAWIKGGSGDNEDFLAEEAFVDSWERSARPYADFVSVESIAVGHVIHHLGVTGRFPLVEPYRETGSFFPSNLPEELVPELLDITERAIRAMGSPVGVFHTEVKLTPDGFRVIEVNGRMGGATISTMTIAADGSSLLENAILTAVDREFVPAGRRTTGPIEFSLYFPAPMAATKVVSTEGLQSLQEIDGVKSVFIKHKPGSALSWRLGSADAVFYVTGSASDHNALWKLRDAITQAVLIEYENE
jgi:biotin carboxylase